jgi:catechol 2,3-dioxygenase-like lactoylglutathione lyase family enzyme
MSAQQPEIERVDFVSIPVRDLARADAFYGEVLGLERSPKSSERWVEYETGNVTLALISPAAMGPQFLEDFRPIWMPVALRVPDVAEARRRGYTTATRPEPMGRDRSAAERPQPQRHIARSRPATVVCTDGKPAVP